MYYIAFVYIVYYITIGFLFIFQYFYGVSGPFQTGTNIGTGPGIGTVPISELSLWRLFVIGIVKVMVVIYIVK